MKYISHLYFCLALFFTSALFGQSNTLRFNHLSLDKGLSQSTVNVMIQDKQGFIWVGTQEGLQRYDGFEFETYYHEIDDSNTLTNDFVLSLFQDVNDNIWVGTSNGLNILNPFTKKINQDLPRHLLNHFTNQKVTSMVAENDSVIWIATANNGLTKYNIVTEIITNIYFDNELLYTPQLTKVSFYNNQLFVGTIEYGLWRLNELNKLEPVLKQDSKGAGYTVWSLTNSKDFFFIGTTEGIYQLHEGKLQLAFKGLPRTTITAVYVGENDTYYIGTADNGIYIVENENGKYVANNYKSELGNASSLSNSNILVILEDFSKTIWIGTKLGINTLNQNKQVFKHYSYDPNNINSLPNPNVWSISQDKYNAYWIGTDIGVSRMNADFNAISTTKRITSNIKIPDNNALYMSFYDKAYNRMLLGYVDGLFYTSPGFQLDAPVDFKKIVLDSTHPNGQKIHDVFVHGKYYYVATNSGLSIVDRHTLKSVTKKPVTIDGNEQADDVIRNIEIDSRGNIWLATDFYGLCRAYWKDGEIKIDHQLSVQKQNLILDRTGVLSLYLQNDSILWLGTYGEGLVLYNIPQNITEIYNYKDGLPNDVVYSILADNRDLWLSTNKGLSRFSIDDKIFKNYTISDGLQSNEFNHNADFINDDKEMFFGGINGITAFNPALIVDDSILPKIFINDIKVNGKSLFHGNLSSDLLSYKSEINNQEPFVLEYDLNNIEFSFSALHYADPSKNRYKFFLEGLQDSLGQAVSDRKVVYSELNPNEYKFVLYASNNDGLWTKEPLTISFIISTPYWQTWWFRFLIIVAFSLVVYIVVRNRFRLIKNQKEKFELLVRTRTKEVLEQKNKIQLQKEALEEEKEMVDKLLYNVLPQNTVEELKINGKAPARKYALATVLFTDIVGFTNIADEHSSDPVSLVKKLEHMFVGFDKILEEFQLERIKTIGDSYMCVGGVPLRSKSNPIYGTLAALNIQKFMVEFNEKYDHKDKPWKIRLGINSGELLAGVIGVRRIQYDVWGSTVNLASRMETSGMEGKVNVSENTYQYIKPFFNCTYRGKVLAKNVGYVDMYFVDKIKPELSENGEGLVPNEAFFDYVNLHIYSTINYKKAESYIVDFLKEKLPNNLYYHDLNHTLDVCEAAERLAIQEGVKGKNIFLLKTAALFHDAGFVEQYSKNEPIGVAMAQEILPKFGFNKSEVKTISRLILVTMLPHEPKDLLEQIMCDADLDYLGRDDFDLIADDLRKELMERHFVSSYKQWDEIQVNFLSNHQFFTNTAIRTRNNKKNMHLQKLISKLQNFDYNK